MVVALLDFHHPIDEDVSMSWTEDFVLLEVGGINDVLWLEFSSTDIFERYSVKVNFGIEILSYK